MMFWENIDRKNKKDIFEYTFMFLDLIEREVYN
ncbi:MAG: hypothetical protein PWP37_1420 [Thermotogota bacterium]|nr:hypothetical protein [Thermotogota bacterium]MDK2865228.1 hypothetical protein [Thermotogota bacterium]